MSSPDRSRPLSNQRYKANALAGLLGRTYESLARNFARPSCTLRSIEPEPDLFVGGLRGIPLLQIYPAQRRALRGIEAAKAYLGSSSTIFQYVRACLPRMVPWMLDV